MFYGWVVRQRSNYCSFMIYWSLSVFRRQFFKIYFLLETASCYDTNYTLFTTHCSTVLLCKVLSICFRFSRNIEDLFTLYYMHSTVCSRLNYSTIYIVLLILEVYILEVICPFVSQTIVFVLGAWGVSDFDRLMYSGSRFYAFCLLAESCWRLMSL